jgi:hypothetical protein
MDDITATSTKDCGTPTCSYKIQDTNVDGVCNNAAAVSSANYPDDTDDYI